MAKNRLSRDISRLWRKPNSRATYPVHKSELLIGELLLLGDHVLGELEERVLVPPEQLSDGHLDEGLDLEDVHDGGHGQAQEARGVLRLRRGRQHGDVRHHHHVVHVAHARLRVEPERLLLLEGHRAVVVELQGDLLPRLPEKR